jgi:hypothetical protein
MADDEYSSFRSSTAEQATAISSAVERRRKEKSANDGVVARKNAKLGNQMM